MNKKMNLRNILQLSAVVLALVTHSGFAGEANGEGGASGSNTGADASGGNSGAPGVGGGNGPGGSNGSNGGASGGANGGVGGANGGAGYGGFGGMADGGKSYGFGVPVAVGAQPSTQMAMLGPNMGDSPGLIAIYDLSLGKIVGLVPSNTPATDAATMQDGFNESTHAGDNGKLAVGYSGGK